MAFSANHSRLVVIALPSHAHGYVMHRSRSYPTSLAALADGALITSAGKSLAAATDNVAPNVSFYPEALDAAPSYRRSSSSPSQKLTNSALKAPKYKVCRVKMQQQRDASKNIATLSDELSIGLSIDESTWCDYDADYYSVDADNADNREIEDESIELEKDASNQIKEEKLQLGSFPEAKEDGKSPAGTIRFQYTPRRCGKHQHQPSSRQIEYYSTSTGSESDEDNSPNHGDHETKRCSSICYAGIGRSSSINSSSSSQSRVRFDLGEFQCADPKSSVTTQSSTSKFTSNVEDSEIQLQQQHLQTQLQRQRGRVSRPLASSLNLARVRFDIEKPPYFSQSESQDEQLSLYRQSREHARTEEGTDLVGMDEEWIHMDEEEAEELQLLPFPDMKGYEESPLIEKSKDGERRHEDNRSRPRNYHGAERIHPDHGGNKIKDRRSSWGVEIGHQCMINRFGQAQPCLYPEVLPYLRQAPESQDYLQPLQKHSGRHRGGVSRPLASSLNLAKVRFDLEEYSCASQVSESQDRQQSLQRHPGRNADTRIEEETDSFGVEEEWIHMEEDEMVELQTVPSLEIKDHERYSSLRMNEAVEISKYMNHSRPRSYHGMERSKDKSLDHGDHEIKRRSSSWHVGANRRSNVNSIDQAQVCFDPKVFPSSSQASGSRDNPKTLRQHSGRQRGRFSMSLSFSLSSIDHYLPSPPPPPPLSSQQQQREGQRGVGQYLKEQEKYPAVESELGNKQKNDISDKLQNSSSSRYRSIEHHKETSHKHFEDQNAQRSSSCQIGIIRISSVNSFNSNQSQMHVDPKKIPFVADQASGSQDLNQPSEQQSEQQRGEVIKNYPPPSQQLNMIRSIQATRAQYNTNIDVTAPDYEDELSTCLPSVGSIDDEVSALSFMGDTVQSSPGNVPSFGITDEVLLNYNQEPQNQDQAAINAQSQSLTTMHHTYDAKGRCIHHSHVRLRKRKLFGRGWIILMSACPDCCVEELQKVMVVGKSKSKVKVKEKSFDGRDRDTASQLRSNISMGSNNSFNSPKMISSPPSLPPQLSSISLPRDNLRNASINKSVGTVPIVDKSKRPSDYPSDDTTSLTGSSSGSSNGQIGESLSQSLNRRSSGVDEANITFLDKHQGLPQVDNKPVLESSEHKKKRKPKCMSKDRQQEQRPQLEKSHEKRSTMRAVQIRYTDIKGRCGTYNGQVNDNLVPHGKGTFEYDHNGRVKDGEWKNGQYRSSNGGSKSVKGSRSGSHSRSKPRKGERLGRRSRSTSQRQRSSSGPRQYQVQEGTIASNPFDIFDIATKSK